MSQRDDTWSATQALSRTYCVSTQLGGDHGRVATAMTNGVSQPLRLGVDHALPPVQRSSDDLSMTETDKAGVRSLYGS